MLCTIPYRLITAGLIVACLSLSLSIAAQRQATSVLTPEQKAQACAAFDGAELILYLNSQLYQQEMQEVDQQLAQDNLPLEQAIALDLKRQELKKMRATALDLVGKQLKERTTPCRMALKATRTFEDFKLPQYAHIVEVGYSYYYTLRIKIQVQLDQPQNVYCLYGYVMGADNQPNAHEVLELNSKGKYHYQYLFVKPHFTPQSLLINGYQ